MNILISQQRLSRGRSSSTSRSSIVFLRILICLTLLLSFHIDRIECAYQPGGLQTGPDTIGSTFASSILYEPNKNAVYITGATYGHTFNSTGMVGNVWADIEPTNSNPTINNGLHSSCFLTVVQLPYINPTSVEPNGNIQFIESQTIQNSIEPSTNDEYCTSLLRHGSKNRLIVTGYTDTSNSAGKSTLSSIFQSGSLQKHYQVGMVLQLNESALDLNGANIPVVGGIGIENAAVTYPLEIFGRPGDTYIYVISQECSNSSKAIQPATPIDVRDPFASFTVGSKYRLSISRFDYKQDDWMVYSPDNIQETFTSSWKEPAATTDSMSAYVTGMTEIDDIVYIVGYTAGKGTVFGAADESVVDGTIDGFITKLDGNAGKYVSDLATNSGSSINTTPYRRIKSTNQRNDQIMGLCTGSITEQQQYYIYIVGYTEGYFDTQPDGSTASYSTQAFLMKINADTLDTTWTYQIGAVNDDNAVVQGLACAVTPDGTEVWIGGNIENNGAFEDTTSTGGTDVFVIKLETTQGNMIFTKQFGSSADDTMAARNGLTVDSGGNAIVVGNTYGSMYRERNSNLERYADIFVTTISRSNGEMIAPLESTTTVSEPTDAAVPVVPLPSEPTETAPVQVPVPVEPSPTPAPVVQPAPVPLTPQIPDGVQADSNSGGSPISSSAPPPGATDNNSRSWAKAISTLCVLAVLGIGCAMFASRSMSYKEVTTDRSKVLPYVGDFDVEEIDLKHSATGGWHCSYTGDLALGKNRRGESYENGGSNGLHTNFVDIDPLSRTSSYNLPGSESLLGSTQANNIIMDDGDEFNNGGRSGLLMGDGNAPSLGNDGSGRGSRARPMDRYADLISDFNASWEQQQDKDKNKLNGSGVWGKDII